MSGSLPPSLCCGSVDSPTVLGAEGSEMKSLPSAARFKRPLLRSAGAADTRARPSVAPQLPRWPRGTKQQHTHRGMDEMEVGPMDAEGSGSSLLYLLAWKMSLHVNFVKSQPAVSVTAGVLQIKNGPWVFVRACVRVCGGG